MELASLELQCQVAAKFVQGCGPHLDDTKLRAAVSGVVYNGSVKVTYVAWPSQPVRTYIHTYMYNFLFSCCCYII